MKIAVVYGTRPEAIKLAPLIHALNKHKGLQPIVISTGQHKEMLDQVNSWFNISPDHELNVFSEKQTLSQLLSKIVWQIDKLFSIIKPDALLIQGDTTTVLGAAIATFYNMSDKKIPVIHLEAGLRSHNIDSPYPEEANRRLVSQIATLHLAPTTTARQNLLNEGNDGSLIAVTGNTVIDALEYTINKPTHFDDPRVEQLINSHTPYILATCHRRENWGEPMRRAALALKRITERLPDYRVLLPMHGNPQVQRDLRAVLDLSPNAILTQSLPYPQFSHAMNEARLIISDSGGVQEEAPSLGKPVLVLRENTERPEAVRAGTVKLVGTDTDVIVNEACRLLTDDVAYAEMAHAENPFGDGHAAEHCVHAIEKLMYSQTQADLPPEDVPPVSVSQN